MRNTSKLRRAGASATAGLLVVACAACTTGESGDAEDYPTGRITLVIPGAAGSSNDAMGRQLATIAEDELDVPVVVQNYGTETQGLSNLKDAEPNGYTVGLAPAASLTLFPLTQETGYGSADADFEVIAQTDVAPIVLLAKESSPLKTLQDYVDELKATGAAVKVGGPSGRGIPAVNVAQLATAAGGDNYEYVGFPRGNRW